MPELGFILLIISVVWARFRLNSTLSLARLSVCMPSAEPMIPVEHRVFTSQAGLPARADYAFMDDLSEGKWPVWLRFVTIIGLSAGLWAAIISAVVWIIG